MVNALVIRRNTQLAKAEKALRAAQYGSMSTELQRYRPRIRRPLLRHVHSNGILQSSRRLKQRARPEWSDHIGLIRNTARNIARSSASYTSSKSQERERSMRILNLAIVGTAVILTSALAGPAMAKGTMAKGAKDKQASHAQSQSHMQGRAAYRSERFRDANAVVTRDQYRPMGPVGAAGAVVGGAVATAGAIATAPFRAFDGGYNSL